VAEVIYINAEEGKKRVMNNGKLYAKLLESWGRFLPGRTAAKWQPGQNSS